MSGQPAGALAVSFFRRKPDAAPAIPRYVPEPKLEPKPEPMTVEENLDPSESMILRVRDAIVKRWRGE